MERNSFKKDSKKVKRMIVVNLQEWDAFKEKAHNQEKSASEVLRKMMENYIESFKEEK